jgi:hypothetical protein
MFNLGFPELAEATATTLGNILFQDVVYHFHIKTR